MQPDWARYIFASAADYFKEVAADNNLPVVVDHLDERTESFMRATDRAEVRITGPVIKHPSNGYYIAYVDVSILLTSRYDGKRKNAYEIVKNAGAFQSAMDLPIAVWNFGGEPGDYDEDNVDSQVFLGCLNLRPGTSVQVIHYGQTAPEEKSKMSEVNCRLYMELYE
jgi:hypothetical protein